MAQSLLRYTAYYIVILTVCVDQGDGRWGEKDKETLKHDIELYRRMAEKIEREIQTFYDEYPEERLERDNVDRIHFTRVTNLLNRQLETKKKNEYVEKIKPNLYSPTTTLNSTAFNQNIQHHKTNTLDSAVEVKQSNSEWPKFEDILLEIGKKYDWKDDRWIKVRRKIKKNNVDVGNLKKTTENNNSVIIHEKHKFSYRIVKLNRSKSRRSIVVAVSAVR
ncbi:hypothetical protein K1T71_007252 [Dendrolimus kikuchii]|uniref:Uncharacterized protein n=1 Tax=Dendrolimus kikuchii TaxID=765133 RepID=A0ACC1D023_9NEOP|nr:hypothetical protein K1T71_007252 [Dendrolimus kikuchii]